MIFFIHGAGCTADACPVADSLDALLGPMNRLGYSSAETWEASWASLKSQTAGAGNNALFIGESMAAFGPHSFRGCTTPAATCSIP